MAENLEKNPLVGDKTGMSIYELEQEMKGIFTRTMGHEAAEQLIDAFDKMIDVMREKNNPIPTIVMINEHGKVIGSLVNCRTVRERLRRDGFEICGSVATKQYVQKKPRR